MASVVIRNTAYTINPFSDIHLSTVNKLLNDIGNIAFQSDTGFVLKEVILPELPPDIIKRTAAGEYIIFLSASELNNVLTEVMKFYYQSELKKSSNASDPNYQNQIKANLKSLESEQPIVMSSESELEQLKAEIALLKGKEAK